MKETKDMQIPTSIAALLKGTSKQLLEKAEKRYAVKIKLVKDKYDPNITTMVITERPVGASAAQRYLLDKLASTQSINECLYGDDVIWLAESWSEVELLSFEKRTQVSMIAVDDADSHRFVLLKGWDRERVTAAKKILEKLARVHAKRRDPAESKSDSSDDEDCDEDSSDDADRSSSSDLNDNDVIDNDDIKRNRRERSGKDDGQMNGKERKETVRGEVDASGEQVNSIQGLVTEQFAKMTAGYLHDLLHEFKNMREIESSQGDRSQSTAHHEARPSSDMNESSRDVKQFLRHLSVDRRKMVDILLRSTDSMTDQYKNSVLASLLGPLAFRQYCEWNCGEMSAYPDAHSSPNFVNSEVIQSTGGTIAPESGEQVRLDGSVYSGSPAMPSRDWWPEQFPSLSDSDDFRSCRGDRDGMSSGLPSPPPREVMEHHSEIVPLKEEVKPAVVSRPISDDVTDERIHQKELVDAIPSPYKSISPESSDDDEFEVLSSPRLSTPSVCSQYSMELNGKKKEKTPGDSPDSGESRNTWIRQMIVRNQNKSRHATSRPFFTYTPCCSSLDSDQP